MKRELIGVEPVSTYLENWKASTSAATRCGDIVYVSGLPPFDPETGKVIGASASANLGLRCRVAGAFLHRDRLCRGADLNNALAPE
jgi:enamine deaminase RidA (YjgF/YER057c/UK114 family)